MNDFFVSKIMHLPSFATAGETFISPIRRHFPCDERSVSAPVPRGFERALKIAEMAVPLMTSEKASDYHRWISEEIRGPSAR